MWASNACVTPAAVHARHNHPPSGTSGLQGWVQTVSVPPSGMYRTVTVITQKHKLLVGVVIADLTRCMSVRLHKPSIGVTKQVGEHTRRTMFKVFVHSATSLSLHDKNARQSDVNDVQNLIVCSYAN